MKTTSRFLLDLKRSLILLKTEKRWFMKTNKRLLLCTLLTTTSSGRITDWILKVLPLMYLDFVQNIEKANLTYYCRDDFDLVPFILERKKIWKSRRKKVEKMKICREDETVFMPSITFLEMRILYVVYTFTWKSWSMIVRNSTV